jgi:hypothetical protein
MKILHVVQFYIMLIMRRNLLFYNDYYIYS